MKALIFSRNLLVTREQIQKRNDGELEVISKVRPLNIPGSLMLLSPTKSSKTLDSYASKSVRKIRIMKILISTKKRKHNLEYTEFTIPHVSFISHPDIRIEDVIDDYQKFTHHFVSSGL